jgi:hypothetical protein
MMSADEKRIRQRLKDDFVHYASKCLKIRSKSGAVEPFILNKAQQHIHEQLELQKGMTGKVRAIILKGRQQGVSTLVGGRFYHKVTHHFGMQAFILTHALDATQNLYKMAQRYYENTPLVVKPEVSTSNAKELIFGKLDSGYKLGTAENKAVGRSATIQLLHACLAAGTPIYDPETGGFKLIEDCKINDNVLTHTGVVAPISYISSKDKECISIKFRTLASLPLTATREHRFWTKEGWKELGELNIGDSIGYPVSLINNFINHFCLPEATKRAHGGGRQFRCPDKIALDYNLGRLVGLYIAEGHIKLQDKHPNLPCYISFSIHRKECERTVSWLEPFKDYYSSMHIKHRQNCLTSIVTIYGSRFASLIASLCGRVATKRFPLDWRSMGEEFNRGMVHGYISGDGSSYLYCRRVNAPSIRHAITISLRDIVASLGYGWGSISIKDGAIRRGRNEKTQYTYSLCGDGATRLAHEIGKPSKLRERNKVESIKENAAKGIEISDGYAWLRIRNIEPAGIKTTYDFEVNHPDHSYCTIHGAAKNSEAAFWNNAAEHAKGIFQAVPSTFGTEIIIESTANGIGNFYHQQWQQAEAGLSDFIAIFVPWYWQEEYAKITPMDFTITPEEEELKFQYNLTNEQINWRRYKIAELSVNGIDGTKAFRQEYPCSANEAFQTTGEDTYIDPEIVMKARKCVAEKVGPLLLGVDPARFGDDRSCIIRRQGRVAFGLESYAKKDTMEITGIVHQIIQSERPAKVFVDVGGLGAGVVDRLFELGHREIVVPVNAGSSPLDSKRYFNKRAELWGLMKEWLLDEPCQIPDNDALHSDLCGIRYKVDSNSRLVMEQKAEMKKRGIRSPDTSDALALTFSLPQNAFENSGKSKQIAAKIMSNYKAASKARDNSYGN